MALGLGVGGAIGIAATITKEPAVGRARKIPQLYCYRFLGLPSSSDFYYYLFVASAQLAVAAAAMTMGSTETKGQRCLR